MKRYNVTGTQNFYGQRDAKTYYNVHAHKMWNCFQYMTVTFNLPILFIYDTKNNYIGSYSAKYKNFTDNQKNRHAKYNF